MASDLPAIDSEYDGFRLVRWTRNNILIHDAIKLIHSMVKRYLPGVTAAGVATSEATVPKLGLSSGSFSLQSAKFTNATLSHTESSQTYLGCDHIPWHLDQALEIGYIGEIVQPSLHIGLSGCGSRDRVCDRRGELLTYGIAERRPLQFFVVREIMSLKVRTRDLGNDANAYAKGQGSVCLDRRGIGPGG